MSGREKQVMKIVVCGPRGSGKTTLTSHLVEENPKKIYPPTIGVEFFSRSGLGEGRKLHFWDLAGGNRYRYITDAYTEKLDLMLYVYKVTDIKQQHKLMKLFHEYVKLGTTRNAIIVGTHTDEEGKRYTDLAESLASLNGLPHMLVSNKTQEGVEALYQEVLTSLQVVPGRPPKKEPKEKRIECVLL